MVLPVFLMPFVVFLATVLVFILALLSDHAGYLHLVSTCSRCFSSCFNSSGLEQMVFALCCSKPTTLCLDKTVWLLSH